MLKCPRVIVALLFVTASLLTPAAKAGEAASSSGPAAQIVVFANEEFLGDHLHIFGTMKDLGKWGNRISSLVIRSGTREFFDDTDFTGTSVGTLKPGMYADVTKHGMKNNSISSVRLAKPAGGSTR
jgi:Beta/Gamma crystallin